MKNENFPENGSEQSPWENPFSSPSVSVPKEREGREGMAELGGVCSSRQKTLNIATWSGVTPKDSLYVAYLNKQRFCVDPTLCPSWIGRAFFPLSGELHLCLNIV